MTCKVGSGALLEDKNGSITVIVSVLVILLITNVILEILNGGIKKAISSILDGN